MTPRPAALPVAALLLAGCTSTVAGAATGPADGDAPGERQLARGSWLLEYTTDSSGTETKTFEMRFGADGGFDYVDGDTGDEVDRNDDPETWELDGAELSLCFNDCYARYEGRWTDGRFEGTAENEADLTWEWTLDRSVDRE